MKGNDKFKMHGAMTLTLTRPDGSTQVVHKDNMIVDAGFDFIADSIGKSSGRPAVMTHIGVGTGAGAAAGGQMTLGNELPPRQSAVYAHVAGTKIFTFSATFEPGIATGPVTEAGVFNAAEGGTMLDRVVFSVINKGLDDILSVVFQFTMS